jgi:hypothetical protein
LRTMVLQIFDDTRPGYALTRFFSP